MKFTSTLRYFTYLIIHFSRIQAIAIGQALIDADLLDPILNVTTPFRDDFTLYRPAEVYFFAAVPKL